MSSRAMRPAYGVDHAPPVHLVNTSPEVYTLWKEKGVRGRVLVHVGRFLHFVPFDDQAFYLGREGFPVETRDLSEEFENALRAENLLFVALKTGIAREIYNVQPSDVFRAKLQAADPAIIKDGAITLHVLGSRRTISGRVPSLEEPVLLNIDASYFSSGDWASLYEMLGKSGLRADLVTLCLSTDIPDATDLERGRLLAFADALAERSTRPR